MAQEVSRKQSLKSPTSVASPKARSATSYFAHSLQPIPSVVPPYYISLFDQHTNAVSQKECEEVLHDFYSFSEELSSINFSNRAAFTHNDSAQSLLELSMSSYSRAESWDQRKSTMRAFVSATFQRAVTVCAANINFATCTSAANFTRRGFKGATYVSEDGYFFHTWKSSAQARHFLSVSKFLFQAIFELQLHSLRVPFTSLFIYRGILFTVTASVPLAPADACNVATEKDGIVQEELMLLCARARTKYDLRLSSMVRAGLDGKFYIASFGSFLAHQLDDSPSSDVSVYLRPEALDAVPLSILHSLNSSSLREYVAEQLIPSAAEDLLKEVALKDNQATTAFKELVVPTVLHKAGINIRFLYSLYERLSHGITEAGDERTDAALECIRTEMVCRSVKEIVRCELRASPGEDEKNHIERVNRLLQSITTKKSPTWNTQLMHVVRKKFDAPGEFSIQLTTDMLKNIAFFVSTRLGCGFQKAQFKFVNFSGLLCGYSIFGAPEELKFHVNRPTPVVQQEGDIEIPRSESIAFLGDEQQAKKGDVQESLLQTWATSMRALQEEMVDTDSLACFEKYAHKLLRVLSIECMLRATLFSSHRSHLEAVLFSELPIVKLEEEAQKYPTFFPSVKELRMIYGHLRTLSMLDSWQSKDAGKVVSMSHILQNAKLEGNIPYVAKLMMAAGVKTGNWKYSLEGLRYFRRATWVDFALVNNYFSTNIHAFHQLRVTSDVQAAKEVLVNCTRIYERFLPVAKRSELSVSLRKMSGAIVASQDEQVAETMKELCWTSLSIHLTQFGLNNPQTGVAHGHYLYVQLLAAAGKLKDTHTLKKFHYFVASMGSMTPASLSSLLDSNEYNHVVSSVIVAIRDIDELAAERGMNYVTICEDSTCRLLAKHIAVLQNGAVSRLQKAARSVMGNAHENAARKLIFCDAAYRAGLWVEQRQHHDRIQIMYFDEQFDIRVISLWEEEDIEWINIYRASGSELARLQCEENRRRLLVHVNESKAWRELPEILFVKERSAQRREEDIEWAFLQLHCEVERQRIIGVEDEEMKRREILLNLFTLELLGMQKEEDMIRAELLERFQIVANEQKVWDGMRGQHTQAGIVELECLEETSRLVLESQLGEQSQFLQGYLASRTTAAKMEEKGFFGISRGQTYKAHLITFVQERTAATLVEELVENELLAIEEHLRMMLGNELHASMRLALCERFSREELIRSAEYFLAFHWAVFDLQLEELVYRDWISEEESSMASVVLLRFAHSCDVLPARQSLNKQYELLRQDIVSNESRAWNQIERLFGISLQAARMEQRLRESKAEEAEYRKSDEECRVESKSVMLLTKHSTARTQKELRSVSNILKILRDQADKERRALQHDNVKLAHERTRNAFLRAREERQQQAAKDAAIHEQFLTSLREKNEETLKELIQKSVESRRQAKQKAQERKEKILSRGHDRSREKETTSSTNEELQRNASRVRAQRAEQKSRISRSMNHLAQLKKVTAERTRKEEELVGAVVFVQKQMAEERGRLRRLQIVEESILRDATRAHQQEEKQEELERSRLREQFAKQLFSVTKKDESVSHHEPHAAVSEKDQSAEAPSSTRREDKERVHLEMAQQEANVWSNRNVERRERQRLEDLRRHAKFSYSRKARELAMVQHRMDTDATMKTIYSEVQAWDQLHAQRQQIGMQSQEELE